FHVTGVQTCALPIYNESAGRVEMYLISIRSQDVRVAGTLIHFAEDESICTEHSYKYSLDEFAALLATAGFRVDRIWTDAKEWFRSEERRVGKGCRSA